MVSNPSLPAPPPLRKSLELGPIALFLDFDGTLVDLAPTPEAIAPEPDLAERLVALSGRFEGRCAIVSGRAIADIEAHIGSLALAKAGSHGADVRAVDGTPIGAPPEEFPQAIATQMRAFAATHAIDYETKPHGGALHYRSDPDKEQVVQSFARDLAMTHGWKAQEGKCVVELVKGDTDKGSAVRALMNTQIFKGAQPIFIGDDLTDEAGFAACKLFESNGILVGEREETVAAFRLPDVASVHHWLEL